MIGTFYRSPEPGAPPFVNVGDRVKKGDVICLIEVMKLINSITADQDGVVAEILVDNAAPVEFGQALMTITPN
jgi:acetyl-CoA carboxylase biotin carboxyl carrier protein